MASLNSTSAVNDYSYVKEKEMSTHTVSLSSSGSLNERSSFEGKQTQNDTTTLGSAIFSSTNLFDLGRLNETQTPATSMDCDDNSDESTFQFIETEIEDNKSFEALRPDQKSLDTNDFFLHRGVVLNPSPISKSISMVDLKYRQTMKPLKKVISDNCMFNHKIGSSEKFLKKTGQGAKIKNSFSRRSSFSNFREQGDLETGKTTLDPETLELEKGKSNLKKRSVSFHKLEVREYDLTMCDNPSVSIGPPVGLDWHYKVLGTADIEEFEKNRCHRRTQRELLMNYYYRVDLLKNSLNFNEAEIAKVVKEINRTKIKRSITNALLPASKVEEVVESAIRKTRRVIKRTRSTGQVNMLNL